MYALLTGDGNNNKVWEGQSSFEFPNIDNTMTCYVDYQSQKLYYSDVS